MGDELADECGTCGEGFEGECPSSKRECGHHCNHVWEHNECCWCPYPTSQNIEKPGGES